METKLFETLSKCKLQLTDAVQSLDQLDKVSKIGENEYTVKIMNEKLQNYKTGWTKYLLFTFPKIQSTSNKNLKVSSILHLIHASESDIVICRVAKRSPKTKEVNVRYLLMQSNKEQLCSNLRELYQCMSKSYNYDGRVLIQSDFLNK